MYIYIYIYINHVFFQYIGGVMPLDGAAIFNETMKNIHILFTVKPILVYNLLFLYIMIVKWSTYMGLARAGRHQDLR